MNRKNFVKRGIIGLGTLVGVSSSLSSCTIKDGFSKDVEGCSLSPRETAGPFPNKSPAQLARENIISDRKGVALLIQLTVQKQSISCQPLAGALVDVWHCDAKGYYSQYGDMRLQETDERDKDYLRGRQTTDAQGKVSFISIFPGWYRGRAPHIHVEVLDSDENSLRVTQVAFPEEICNEVYATQEYVGAADTTNERDGLFRGSLDGNMLDSLTGNLTDGYTLEKIIVV